MLASLRSDCSRSIGTVFTCAGIHSGVDENVRRVAALGEWSHDTSRARFVYQPVQKVEYTRDGIQLDRE